MLAPSYWLEDVLSGVFSQRINAELVGVWYPIYYSFKSKHSMIGTIEETEAT
jgi:hypothetical protein